MQNTKRNFYSLDLRCLLFKSVFEIYFEGSIAITYTRILLAKQVDHSVEPLRYMCLGRRVL